MIREGADLTEDVEESCDVVVIGSGCGGATVAKALSERGHDVVILEQGGAHTARDFDQRELNMLAKIDGGRGLDASHDLAVALTYGHTVGGASVHYWADSYRTPADRLELWAERYGLTGHTAGELAPHFARLEADLNVHEADDTYVNRMNALLRDAARALGWRAKKVPQARKGCVRSGHCMQGCAYDAKQSQLVTHIPAALGRGARLYADCRASRLLWAGGRPRRVEGVVAQVLDRATRQPTDREVTVRAKATVVCAGGFETPAFLLRQGLGSGLPHLGRHFFCNPCPMVHALYDDDIVQWRNIPAAWGVEEFRLSRHDAGGTERTHFFGELGAYVEGGYLLMANQNHPAVLGALIGGIGADHRRVMAQLPRLGGTIAWIDDAEGGDITVDHGRRLIRVPLRGGNELRIRDAWRKQARLLLRSGARELLFGDSANTRLRADELGSSPEAAIDAAVASIDLRPGRNVFAAPHPGGGARMGADPTDSVVDCDHRVHGTANLFISDPSTFPTPPSVDPSLTIMAFSYVAAERVSQQL